MIEVGGTRVRDSRTVHTFRRWLLRKTLALSFVVAFAAAAAAQGPLPDVDRFGPQVGEAVPDFALADQHGAARDLASLAGPNGTMLVFSRSADW